MNSNHPRWLLFAGVVMIFGVSGCTTTQNDGSGGTTPGESIFTECKDSSCETVGKTDDPEILFNNCVNSISSGLAPDIRRRLEMKCERLLKE